MKQTKLGRWLVGLVAALALSMSASVAMAMDTDQIIQMTEMGLSDQAIMGAIDSADGSLGLDEDDVAALEESGVSEDVLNHLRRRGHIDDGEEAVADEDVDIDDIDDLDDLAPAPAPAEDGETQAEREERERLEAERERIRQELEEEQRREEEAERQAQERERAANRVLPSADEDVEAGNNMEAARQYLEFLDMEPEHGGEHWYRATFGLAKALVQEGIFSGAANPLLEVLMIGPEGPEFQEAFGMLETMTREIGFQPPMLEDMTTFYLGDTSQSFQNRFNYYLGKFFYDYNRMEQALTYLERVPEGAPQYPEARYLAGVAMLADEVEDIPGALQNFERAIRAAEAAGVEDPENQDILQLGYLALARVFFEVGFFDVALYYYQQIPSESARHADAMFESAWSYFMKNDFERALGAFHSLHSPYYAGRYYPELYILEATAYLNMCNYPRAERSVEQFRRDYLDQRPALSEYLEDTFEPEEFWELMETAYNGDGGEIPELFTNAVLEDLNFYNTHQVVRALEHEKRSLEANIDELGEFGQSVLEDVERQLEMNIEEGGIVVQQRLTEVDQELQRWENNAQQIEFDIQSEAREQLQRRIRTQEIEERQAEGGTTLMVVADDWQSWTFEGEYWLDEVDSYRSRMRTECIEQ